MIWIVDTLYKYMLAKFEQKNLDWVKKRNVTRDFTHGRPSFVGYSCKFLLSKFDILRSFCGIRCLKYIKCFQIFQFVVHRYFSGTSLKKYNQVISYFQKVIIISTFQLHPTFMLYGFISLVIELKRA